MSCKIVLTNYNSPFIIGNYVVGKVTCDIKTPEEIRGITIKLRGLEWVQWTRNKQTISAKNKFLKQDIQLANEGQLSAGLHDFSFSFMLPLNIPTSFTGRYGWIIYSLIAKVDRPRKLNYKHTLRIPVISPIDLDLVIDKSVLRPFGFEDEKTLCCGCCSKGQIAVDVRLDKKVFVPGDIIKIKVRVTNQTNEKITKVKVYFRMDVRSTVKVVLGKSFIDDRTLIAKTKDGGVGARDEKHFELLLPLPMFDAVPNFLNCELLSIVSGIEEKKSDSKRMKSDDRRMNDDGRRTVRRQNDDDRRTVRRQKGERKSDGWRTNGGDRRTVRRQKGERNSDGKRTNGGDRRTVRRRKGESNSDGKRTNDDDKRTETRRRGAKKVNRIEKEFQENREEIERRLERRLEDTKRQVQKEILEKIEGLEHQLHRTSIADSGDCSTSPATPLQHSSLMHTERSVHKMLKPPTYDGQSSWSMYRRQFEAAAKANGWTPQEMATSLVISLRGQALEILQSIPEEQQNDYDRIVGALEIRYGHKYLRQVYQSQIKSRQQRTNESLQEYEADIERLTQKCSKLCGRRHTTISDVLVAALEFKAAKEASRNYKPKVRQVTFDESQSLKETIEKIMRDTLNGMREMKSPQRRREAATTVGELGTYNVFAEPDLGPRQEVTHQIDKRSRDPGLGAQIKEIGEKTKGHRRPHSKGIAAPLAQIEDLVPDRQRELRKTTITDIRDDCILGLDILSKHGFVVDIKNRIIQIQNEEIVMAPKLQDYNQSRRIIIEEDIQIPQGSENIVIARLDGNGEGLSTGIVEARERNDGLLVARSLVQINNQIPNEVLGRCEPVEKIVKCEEVNQARTNQARVRDPTIAEPLLKNAAHLEPEEVRKARQFLDRYQDVFANGNITGRTSLVVCVLPPLHCNMRTFVPVHLADIPLGGLNDYVARIKNTEVFTGKRKAPDIVQKMRDRVPKVMNNR
ncbi:hypothetical protein NQ318_000015 [Aromia moschata]|uniref:Arrestin C-terminal-like domain-containing protein n=1 Tax=Aromia moschata TaxID=1265417 RepID=A0AAV8YD55_9CUCU|nr:hypothetical protein NQ318_000015 [Aromia moschata]